MPSSFCQGLQSCLEPGHVEPLVLKLKLAPSKSNFPGRSPDMDDTKAKFNNQENDNQITTTTNNNYKNNTNDYDTKFQNNVDMGGWSFLQSLSNPSENTKQVDETEKVYVHPLVKKSSSKLSEKSLEMCTESLGSETGSESSDDFNFVLVESENSVAKERSKLREIYAARKIKRGSNFPPPLTSISGSNGVKVKSHREDGRLVLKAVTISSPPTCFHAERSGGRLTLRLLKDSDSGANFDNEEDEVEEKEGVEDMEGNSGNVGGDIGMGKFQRQSRCMECGHGNGDGYLNWDQCWVAT